MPAFPRKLTDTLTVTQNASFIKVKRASALDTIELFQTAIAGFKVFNVVSFLDPPGPEIGLRHSVTTNRIISESVSDIIVLNQSTFKTSAVLVSANNVLDITQDANNSAKGGVASNTLALAQSVNVSKPINVAPSTDISLPLDEIPTGLTPEELAAFLLTIGLRDKATYNIVCNCDASSILLVSQQAASIVPLTASSHIQLSNLAERVLSDLVFSTLSLSQSVIINITLPIESVLTLTQSATKTQVTNKSRSSLLDLISNVTLYKANNITFGDTSPAIVTPVKRNTIVLTYPYEQPTFILELRNPQFDDTEQLEFRRINRLTRGGTLKLFRDPQWPSAERLIYTFDNLKEKDVKDYLNFVQTSLGKEVGLLDYESRQWKGFIITPNASIEEEDRPGFDVLLEFEGVIDPGGIGMVVQTKALMTAFMTIFPPGLSTSVNVTGNVTVDVVRV